MTFDEALTYLPENWRFTHLLALDPSGFQVNLLNETEYAVVVGTNTCTVSALCAAIANTREPKKWMPLYDPNDHAAPDAPLRSSLDIAKLFLRREPINRRL